jgi:hypothetical protein
LRCLPDPLMLCQGDNLNFTGKSRRAAGPTGTARVPPAGCRQTVQPDQPRPLTGHGGPPPAGCHRRRCSTVTGRPGGGDDGNSRITLPGSDCHHHDSDPGSGRPALRSSRSAVADSAGPRADDDTTASERPERRGRVVAGGFLAAQADRDPPAGGGAAPEMPLRRVGRSLPVAASLGQASEAPTQPGRGPGLRLSPLLASE